MEEWRHIVEGIMQKIGILNYHRNLTLTYFQMSQNMNCWQAHLSLFLSGFDFPSSTGQDNTQLSKMPSLVGWIIRLSKKRTTKTKWCCFQKSSMEQLSQTNHPI